MDHAWLWPTPGLRRPASLGPRSDVVWWAVARGLLPSGAQVPAWARGVAYPELNLVVVQLPPGDPEIRATLRHELSHVAVGRLTGAAVPRRCRPTSTCRAGVMPASAAT